MKLFKSIKWRLQLWYGLILVVVLAGFGLTAYQLERNRQFRHVDDELHKRFGVLANTLHRPGQRPPGGGNRNPGGGPDFLTPPPQQQFPDDDPPEFQQRPMPFNLSSENEALFGSHTSNDYWFRITREVKGKLIEIARSSNWDETQTFIDDKSFLNQANRVDLPSGADARRPKYLRAGDQQIILEILPSKEILYVGCSLKPINSELRQTALNLAGVGGVILLIGLVGGWWFVNRSLRPIAEITSTATKISAGDLSQRINVAEAESELGQLAAVLNSTFARLETAFAQQKQFASDAAHELRTPVSVILTQTQMALGRERDAAGYKQTVEACQRAAQRMRKLIESLLELARFDAGQETLKRLQFDVSKTIADSVEMVQTLAEEKRVKIITELSPLEITGDSERLAQVVTNLLTNAIQYNKADGEVRVNLAAEAGLVVLTITDTGNGIAPEDLPRVFERFYRADKSRTGAGNSGLGLSICKAIVEAHGGTIEVKSEKDSGTTFTVRLPV